MSLTEEEEEEVRRAFGIVHGLMKDTFVLNMAKSFLDSKGPRGDSARTRALNAARRINFEVDSRATRSR